MEHTFGSLLFPDENNNIGSPTWVDPSYLSSSFLIQGRCAKNWFEKIPKYRVDPQEIACATR